jgi:FixJ family two-component response regulator
VLEATDAESALELLRDVAGRNIRVVLTDVVMPGMWGDDLARCIAAERQDVRLVLMTGRSPEALPDAALRDLPLLRKPFSRSQLLAAVAG